jgi:hypothetical protein
MAFAAAVIKQEKMLADCPRLDKNVIDGMSEKIDRQVNLESIQEEFLLDLRKRIGTTNLAALTQKLGARVSGHGIVIQCLGKDFAISGQGAVASHCHTHAWFSIPLLDYVLSSSGMEISGRWVPFRELVNGKTWAPLFERRCEKPLQRIADAHPDLFEDLVAMFSARSSKNEFASDISIVLFPLPLVPILICYWKPEDGMNSKLHVFFDETAEQNLPIQSLFTLATSLVRMFEKIMLTHSDRKIEVL